MTTYKVYTHPTNGVEAVKVGFSWPAFFFSIFWAMFKKMWMVALILFGAALAIAVAQYLIFGEATSTASTSVDRVSNLVYAVIVGNLGNGLRERNLLSRGYVFAHETEASSVDGAKAQVRVGKGASLTT